MIIATSTSNLGQSVKTSPCRESKTRWQWESTKPMQGSPSRKQIWTSSTSARLSCTTFMPRMWKVRMKSSLATRYFTRFFATWKWKLSESWKLWRKKKRRMKQCSTHSLSDKPWHQATMGSSSSCIDRLRTWVFSWWTCLLRNTGLCVYKSLHSPTQAATWR